MPGSPLHHDVHALQKRDVAQHVTSDRDDVRILAWRDGANILVHLHRHREGDRAAVVGHRRAQTGELLQAVEGGVAGGQLGVAGVRLERDYAAAGPPRRPASSP